MEADNCLYVRLQLRIQVSAELSVVHQQLPYDL